MNKNEYVFCLKKCMNFANYFYKFINKGLRI